VPSKTTTRRPPSEPPGPERIVDIDVGDEMRGSFLEYAYSVIYSRALPDARDGLKPVQRRILYQMAEMGLRPDRGHVKSARVVGEVMGRLHPHGDSAIYDALVRMAQPFSLRLPLVDGHGNFGSLDDGPAAMRYTECRLASAASTLTASLDEDVVDFAPNYDGREQEPVVMPAAVPMLLVNGASGIAVGMATNMAPHNLVEVCAAAKLLLNKPSASLDEVMKLVPGPDLPTGGHILGMPGIRDAYETGKGAFRMRATTRIEQVSPRRKGLVITSLPYGVGPERVIEKIKELVVAKRIEGIADLTDLTDGEHGLNLVVEIKSGFSPEAVRDVLFRLTPLEEQFNVNSVALVDGQPRTLGLLDMLRVFLEHRIQVVTRRSDYRRRKAMDRLHLVDGLLIATLNIDEVVALIRTSDDATIAKARLIQVFELSDIQATHILDMPLRRLTKYSRIELENEQEGLLATIAELSRILAEPKVLQALVAKELDAAALAHGTPRRSVLVDGPIPPAAPASVAAATSLEVPDEPCLVVLTAQGLLARTSPAVEGGQPEISTHALRSVILSSTRSHVGVVSSAGMVYRVPVVDLPMTSSGRSVAGAVVTEYAAMAKNESPVGLVDLSADSTRMLALGTSQGVVKRVIAEIPPGKESWEVVALKSDDRVVGAGMSADSDELVFVTSDAQLLHFAAAAVRPQGRAAAGMAGVKASAQANVVFFGVVTPTAADLVVVTVAGSLGQLNGTSASSVKLSAWNEFPGKGRATFGVRCHRLVKGEDAVLGAWAGVGPALAETNTGKPVALPADRKARDASGDKVADAALSTLGGSSL
jgi:DNA gyrase subunit A